MHSCVGSGLLALEYVYAHRVPKVRKRKHYVADDNPGTKARWVGPGVVITPDGANLWASMLGELWKAAQEQCRPATNDERMGIEAVMTERQEVVEQFRRNSNRMAYKDITEDQSGKTLQTGEGHPNPGSPGPEWSYPTPALGQDPVVTFVKNAPVRTSAKQLSRAQDCGGNEVLVTLKEKRSGLSALDLAKWAGRQASQQGSCFLNRGKVPMNAWALNRKMQLFLTATIENGGLRSQEHPKMINIALCCSCLPCPNQPAL